MGHNPRRKRIAAACAASSAILALAGSVGAWAYWNSTGEGAGTVSGAALEAPTLTATAGAEAAQLSWSAVTPPGSGTVSYYVTRDGGAPGGSCPASSAPASVTSCTDEGIAIAEHRYTVTAVWRSWRTTSEEKTVKITFGPVTQFTLAAASTAPTAGAADNLTITAKDAHGTTVTTFTGSHNLTFEGASAAPNGSQPTVTDGTGTAKQLGETTAIEFASGVASVQAGSHNGQMTLYKAEEAHIKVKEGSISNGSGLAVTVAPGAFKSFGIEAKSPAEPGAGEAFTAKVSAWDEWHNTITTYARTPGKKLIYSGASNSPSGHAPEYSSNTEPTFTGGVAEVAGFKFYDAIADVLKVEEETSGNKGEGTITVKAGVFKSFGVEPSVGEPTAGTAFSVTLTAWDEWDNTITSYARSHPLKYEGASKSPSEVAPVYGSTTPTFTSGTVTLTGFTFDKAASTTLKVGEEGTTNEGTKTFTVKAAAAEKLAWDGPVAKTGGPGGVTRSPNTGTICLFTCKFTEAGNEVGSNGTFKAKASVTDKYGNIVEGKNNGLTEAEVTQSAGVGTLTNKTLTVTSSGTGAAESSLTFEYKAPGPGASTAVLHLKKKAGTAYTEATAELKY